VGLDPTQPEELRERKSSGSGLEILEYSHRATSALTTRHPSIRIGTDFAEWRRSLGRHSSLANSGTGVCCLFVCLFVLFCWRSVAVHVSCCCKKLADQVRDSLGT
jgi:hypothetical protein